MTPPNPPTIQLLVLDVDGVLTDGGIYVDAHGVELKRYHVMDGFALRLWERMGLRAAVITGRTGQSILHRMADLRVAEVIQGSQDKSAALDEVASRTGIAPAAMAFLGDDWPDLPALRRVGYPMAVANAAPQVKAAAKYITPRPGGSGAVRDAVEHLLTSMNLLDAALHLYDPAYGQG
ncbi:MAG: KdsC family phosphatase [Phycisphaerales bacterium]